jgi:hypothetical protein
LWYIDKYILNQEHHLPSSKPFHIAVSVLDGRLKQLAKHVGERGACLWFDTK